MRPQPFVSPPVPEARASGSGPPTPTAALQEPVLTTLRRLMAQMIELAGGRFELARCEIGDERARIGQLLTRGVLAALLMFLTIQLLAVMLVALVWDTTWRIPVVVALASGSLLATVLMIRAYRATPDSTLFEASGAELARDVHALNGISPVGTERKPDAAERIKPDGSR